MRVNSFHTALRSRSIKVIATIIVAFCTIFLLAAFITDRSGGEMISKKANIAVRAIGHDLLLRSGDSTSVIRPVVQKSDGVFLIEFETEFAFQPDTLVAITQRILDKTDLSRYTVTVYNCLKPGIVYGFEINPPNNSIKACLGRTQPVACYNIEIAFADFPSTPIITSQRALMISGVLSVIALVLIGSNLGAKNSTSVPAPNGSIQNENPPVLNIGRFKFDTTHQRLKIGEQTISLTDKESRILMLLSRNIGQLTLREELIQEVWTDEGVITGRSLDMFISKLRKKLSADPDLRITNLHGKGYSLEIVNEPNA